MAKWQFGFKLNLDKSGTMIILGSLDNYEVRNILLGRLGHRQKSASVLKQRIVKLDQSLIHM